MKIQRQIRIRTKFFKSIVNKTIRHAIETIVHINKAVQSVELERNNTTTACADKYKQTYIAYDIVVKENTSSTSENKEKARDGYVCIYECGKQFCNSTSECAFVAQEKSSVR